MTPVLIHVRPQHPATLTRYDVRCADGPSAQVYGLGGLVWEPAILQRPLRSIELFTPAMDGRVQAGTARFALMLNAVTNLPIDPMTLYWKGAPVKIWSAPDLSLERASLPFDGYVTGAKPDIDARSIVIDVAVSTNFLDKPLLTLEFTGGGDFLGDVGKRGTLKPAGFGIVPNIEPVWFDETDNIGMIDGYGNTITVTGLFEGRSSLGPSMGDYPSYAALKTAISGGTIIRGRWATSIADGCIGLGAPPAGVITADAVFGTDRPGAMMRRWIEAHAGVATGSIDTIAFSALDIAVPRPVHYWTSQQRQVIELLQAMAGSCNASPIVTLQRKVTVKRAVLSSPVATFDRSGGIEPRVINWRSVDSDPPWARLKARTARPGRVLDLVEINYEDDLIDLGDYDNAKTYRQGNIVYQPSNGNRFLYINATPSIGNAPPNTTYWAFFQSADPAIAAAQSTASTALSDAAAAASQAASALLAIADIVNDGILDGSEKPQAVAAWTDITNAQPGLDAQAADFGITTERTNYNNAISALGAYLAGLSPAWNNYSVNTPIVRATFIGKFADVIYAKQVLEARIRAAMLSVADPVTGVIKPNKVITTSVTAYNMTDGASIYVEGTISSINGTRSPELLGYVTYTPTTGQFLELIFNGVIYTNGVTGIAIDCIDPSYTDPNGGNGVYGVAIYPDVIVPSSCIGANIYTFNDTSPKGTCDWVANADGTISVGNLTTTLNSRDVITLTPGAATSGNHFNVFAGGFGAGVKPGRRIWPRAGAPATFGRYLGNAILSSITCEEASLAPGITYTWRIFGWKFENGLSSVREAKV